MFSFKWGLHYISLEYCVTIVYPVISELLEESRDTIKALQSEASLAKRQFDNLQEKYSACAIDIEVQIKFNLIM